MALTSRCGAPAVREPRHRHPGADVQTLYLAPDEPRRALLDHSVDAAVARLPFLAGGPWRAGGRARWAARLRARRAWPEV